MSASAGSARSIVNSTALAQALRMRCNADSCIEKSESGQLNMWGKIWVVSLNSASEWGKHGFFVFLNFIHGWKPVGRAKARCACVAVTVCRGHVSSPVHGRTKSHCARVVPRRYVDRNLTPFSVEDHVSVLRGSHCEFRCMGHKLASK